MVIEALSDGHDEWIDLSLDVFVTSYSDTRARLHVKFIGNHGSRDVNQVANSKVTGELPTMVVTGEKDSEILDPGHKRGGLNNFRISFSVNNEFHHNGENS